MKTIYSPNIFSAEILAWLDMSIQIDIEDSGIIYGGEVGVVWNVINEVDFDLGYRLLHIKIDKVDDIAKFVLCAKLLY